MASTIRVILFGQVSLAVGSRAVNQFRSRRSAALLTLLALKPGTEIHRDWLGERLWPEEDPVTQRDRLRQTLAMLRSDLGDICSIASVGRHHLTIDAGLTTDVADFTSSYHRVRIAPTDIQRLGHLRSAIQTYAGRFAPQLTDEWAEDERRNHETTFVEIARLCAKLLTEQGEPMAARETLLRAARMAPDSAELNGELALLRSVMPRQAKHRPIVSAPLTPIFGRDAEMESVRKMLTDSAAWRCVALLGPGGIGKTRLAREAARQMVDSIEGYIWFVPLATAQSPAAILPAIAERLHSGDTDPGSSSKAEGAVLRRLRDLPSPLLVLDDLDSVADRGAHEVLTGLLEQIPELKILYTSRQAIGVAGEARVVLGTLDAASARAQFTYYACAQSPVFDPTGEELAQVDTICARVDRVPLAIELAASWIGTMTVAQIRERLSLPFLARRTSAGNPRHRTLSDCIGESYRLLTPELQAFWPQLSVFCGGWSLSAAEAISPETNTLAAIADLQDRSLIVASNVPGGIRFGMLETLRTFARSKLSPELMKRASHRHFGYFKSVVDEVERLAGCGRSQEGYALFESNDANIRAAIEFGLTASLGELQDTMEMMRNCALRWWQRGLEADIMPQFHEWARIAASRLPECTGDMRAAALRAAAFLHQYDGHADRAAPMFREAISLHAAHGNHEGQVHAMERLARIYERSGRIDEAVSERMAIAEIHARHENPVAEHTALCHAAATFEFYGSADNYLAAIQILERCREFGRDSTQPALLARSSLLLARMCRRLGRHEQTEIFAAEAMEIFDRLGDRLDRTQALHVLGLSYADRRMAPEARGTLEECLGFLVKDIDPGGYIMDMIAEANDRLAALS